MKKKELLELLNKAADSINLHDASLHGFKWINGTVEFVIRLGKYHYTINELENFVDDVKDRVILTLRFEGIENVECEFCEDFRYKNAEIMENNLLEDGAYELVFLECGNPGRMTFRYKKFVWEVLGELDEEQMDVWAKENAIYDE